MKKNVKKNVGKASSAVAGGVTDEPTRSHGVAGDDQRGCNVKNVAASKKSGKAAKNRNNKRKAIEEESIDVDLHDTEKVKRRHIEATDQQVEDVWAHNRQALCDSLPYFKSHQGGTHTGNKRVKGILVNGSGAEVRDTLGAEVVITTIGGGREKNEKGEMERQEDQHPKFLKECWETTKEQRQPVMIIAGDSYPNLPYKAEDNHRYSVLGAFYVTDIWPERKTVIVKPKAKANAKTAEKTKAQEDGATTEDDPSEDETYETTAVETADGTVIKSVLFYKLRLEKINRSEESWWWSASAQAAMPQLGPMPDDMFHCPIQRCNLCGARSKQIFRQAWTCLNEDCSNKLELPAGIEYNALEYSMEFLKERKPYIASSLSKQIPAVVPELPSMGKNHGTTIANRTGIVCPECKCCGRRRYWDRWECENPACAFVLHGYMEPFPFDKLKTESITAQHALLRKRGAGFKHNSETVVLFPASDKVTHLQSLRIAGKSFVLGGYAIHTYMLPDDNGDIIGSVTVYSANDAIREQEDGPDELLRQMDASKIALRRNAARCAGSWNEVYTRHFNLNYGAPYKFAVAVDSQPFDDAPDVILKALQRLRWAGHLAVKATDKITSDGKFQTGPNTPSQDWQEFNELLALGYMEKDKIDYHDDGEKELGPTVATLSLGSPSVMAFRPKKKKGEDGKVPKANPKDVLRVQLFHGDIVVMHGRSIHGLYDHAVIPTGQRRFAMTSRVIRLDSIETDGEREMARVAGIVPRKADKFRYNGNMPEELTPELHEQMLAFVGEKETDEWSNSL